MYADKLRYSYREFYSRVQRFGALIERLHLEGKTIAVMDWDSHRYLEAFFAVSMSGSVLQTVNIRLSPDQILYTMNHSKARAVFVNAEFLPLLAGIRDKLETVKTFVLLADDPRKTLELDPSKVNPLGSAIALGHPLGATGAIRTAPRCTRPAAREPQVGHGDHVHQHRYGRGRGVRADLIDSTANNSNNA